MPNKYLDKTGLSTVWSKVKSIVPTKTSDLTNDSGFLIEHQDISGKVDRVELKDYLPLSAGSDKAITGNLYVKKSGVSNILINDAKLRATANSDLIISSLRGKGLHLRNGDQFGGIKFANQTLATELTDDANIVSLGTSETPFNNIYGKTIYQNGKQVANKEDIPTKVSQLENDSGFVYTYDISDAIDNFKAEEFEPAINSLNDAIPTATSELTNDSGYITNSVNNLTNYTLSTGVGNKLSVSINNNTYVMTLKLLNSANTVLSTQTVDLPLETMVVSARYDEGKLYLTLKNGTELAGIDISDLISGLVPNTRTINGKALSSNITLKTSDLTNDSGYITSTALAGYQPKDADLTAIAGLTGTSGLLKKTASNTWSLDTTSYATTSDLSNYVHLDTDPVTSLVWTESTGSLGVNTLKGGGTVVSGLALTSDIPTKTSELTNDSGFLTEHQDISGKHDVVIVSTTPTTLIKDIFDSIAAQLGSATGGTVLLETTGYTQSLGLITFAYIGSAVKHPCSYVNLKTLKLKSYTIENITTVKWSTFLNETSYPSTTEYATLGDVTDAIDNFNADVFAPAINSLNDAIPTKTSDLTNDSEFITSTNLTDTINNFKSDEVEPGFNKRVGYLSTPILANTTIEDLYNTIVNTFGSEVPCICDTVAVKLLYGYIQIKQYGTDYLVRFTDFTNLKQYSQIVARTTTVTNFFNTYTNINTTYLQTSGGNITGELTINDKAVALVEDIPTATSDLTNDSGYITSTALAGYQPKDADLTAIAGLTGTSGLLKKTASNTWSLDTTSYATTSALAAKQNKLTSGSNIKTINGESILGSGDITISGGGSGVDIIRLSLTNDNTIHTVDFSQYNFVDIVVMHNDLAGEIFYINSTSCGIVNYDTVLTVYLDIINSEGVIYKDGAVEGGFSISNAASVRFQLAGTGASSTFNLVCRGYK